MTLDPRKKMAADLGDSRHPAAKLPVARSALLHSLSFLVILLASRDRRNNLPAIQPSHTRSCGDNVATRIDGEIVVFRRLIIVMIILVSSHNTIHGIVNHRELTL